MGLLTEGNPLSWEETKKLSKHVRDHGIQQFINMYSRLRDRTGDVLKWGDEVSMIKMSLNIFKYFSNNDTIKTISSVFLINEND